jgi:hypothetical protein
MNQGGGGQHGAIKYSDYDIIVLAESCIQKQGFNVRWSSKTLPEMSVQIKDSAGRLISEPEDVMPTYDGVRPVISFLIKGFNVRVVFVHLKSGSTKLADEELSTAITAVQDKDQFNGAKRTLWIGDFNRARWPGSLDVECLTVGGGNAGWDLDRAYVTGDWTGSNVRVNKSPSTAVLDHSHMAIDISFDK